jgi:hypothetical protein
MIPNTDKHDLIVRDYTKGTPAGGALENVCGGAAGNALSENGGGFASRGCYTSEVIFLKYPANEMILTWNGAAPANASFDVEFRIRGGGADWSGWYQLGAWKPEKWKRLNQNDRTYGPLKVDHLKAVCEFNEVQYRLQFRSGDGLQTAVVRRVSLCVSDVGRGHVPSTNMSPEDMSFENMSPVDLPVPWLSQYDPVAVKDEEMIRCGVCAATVVTMVLNYHGIAVEVAEIARRAYDPNANIFGNWAFLIAAASEFGPDAWVQRFNDLKGIEELLIGGTPVIITVSYKKGDLSVKPDRESPGHLIVVRGVTKAGDFICNDPDVRDPAEFGRPMIYPRRELARAFFGHGGVALIVKK